MMKGMKKLLSIILCLTMVLTMGMMTIPAFAAEDIQTTDAGQGTVQLYYWNFATNKWIAYGNSISGTAGTLVALTDIRGLVDDFLAADKKDDLMKLHGAEYTVLTTNKTATYLDKASTVYYGSLSSESWKIQAAAINSTTKAAINTEFKYQKDIETPLFVCPKSVIIPMYIVDGIEPKWKADTNIKATISKIAMKEGSEDKTDINNYGPVININAKSNKYADVAIKKNDDQNIIYRDNNNNIIYEIDTMTYEEAWGKYNILEYPWLFNVNACLESKFPLSIVISGNETVTFNAVDEAKHKVLFEFGKEIDLSAYKFTSDGDVLYSISELITSISDKSSDLQGLIIKRLYNGGNPQGNLISGNNVKFTIADANDFVNNYKFDGKIALFAETENKQYEIKIKYCTEEYPEVISGKYGDQPVCDSVLVSKSMPYTSGKTIKITDDGLLDSLNETRLFEEAQNAVVGWTVDNVTTKEQSANMSAKSGEILTIDKNNGITFSILYTHNQIPAFIDYNTDFENQKEKNIVEMGVGFTYHGQDLYEANDNGLLSSKLEPLSFVTSNTFTTDDDGNIKDDLKANNAKNKPGRDYEYLGYEVYFYEGTLTAEQIANIDYSKLEPVSKDEEGMLRAKAGTTIIARLLWKNSNDFIIKIYNTKGDLSIAVAKNLKTYYWANNKPCKRSEIIKVENPDKNYVCMYVPGTEQTHCVLQDGAMVTTENTKKVFTLTMAMGTKSNLTIEGRFAFYKTLIDTIKSLIG